MNEETTYEFKNVPLGEDATEMDISPQFLAYSGVEISIGDDEDTVIKYPANDAQRNSSRVLLINNPWGSLEQAQTILASLNETGFRYQPFTATSAILNPAAEIGDGVTLNVVYSGLYKINRTYNSLMAADIEAPEDKEIDHEFPFETKQDRTYQREIDDTKAQLRVTASQIRADVVSKVGGSTQSFGWSLQSDNWTLYSGNATVLRASESGLEVKGKITATSGYIGTESSGFAITASAIWNGMESMSSPNNGVYIGTQGIALGGGLFSVTPAGYVTAKNLSVETLYIGGTGVSAATLNNNANFAYKSTSAGGFCYNGAVKAAQALTDASNAQTTADNAQIKAEKADENAGKALNYLSGSTLVSKMRIGQLYLAGAYRTIGRTSFTIDGTTYNCVSCS